MTTSDTSTTVNWTSTGTASGSFNVTSVFIDPAPAKGVLLTVTLTGTLGAAVNGGNAQLKAKYGIIAVLDQNTPLSPAAAGDYAPRVQFSIPSDAPNGAYKVEIVLTDQNSAEIAGGTFGLKL